MKKGRGAVSAVPFLFGIAFAMLTFLHTAPIHIDTFNTLLRELAPDLRVRHIVDEAILREARDAGRLTEAMQAKVTAQVEALRDAPVVLCTCSTIGGCAEEAGAQAGANVIRVDRPMAARAVQMGSRIIVAATLASTLQPTQDLILDEARRQAKSIELIEVLCDGAWAKFEQGDRAGYVEAIAQRLRQVVHLGDVIVLAQASMADVEREDFGVPVLSSPRIGLRHALAVLKAGPQCD